MTRWNHDNPDLLATMLSSDAQVLYSVLYDEANRDAFISWWKVMLQAFPDLRVQETPLRLYYDSLLLRNQLGLKPVSLVAMK
jgi:hypothetical protein